MNKQKYKLLYVDDDLQSKYNKYIIMPIENEGFDVDMATTGLEAYEMICNNTYHAIIIDNMMAPGGTEDSYWSLSNTEGGLYTGLKLLQKIGDDTDIDPKPKCWVLTALQDTEVSETEKAFPFVVEVIMKDYSLMELAQKIKQKLEKGNDANK